MTERVMARIVKIDAISAIPDADQIETAHIGGWKVVVKKGEFTEGSLAVFAEVDSFIPHALAPFLTEAGKFPKVYNEVEGQRLKSKKIRKVISQGLLLPMSVYLEAFVGSDEDDGQELSESFYVGMDVSALLQITKWEPPSEFRAADAKGNFPHFIPKTDQERIQNLSRALAQWCQDEEEWQVTEKVDGSSMTVFSKDGEVGVCSRNLELKDDGATTFWETAKSEGLVQKLIALGMNIALQGELIGGQIQGNAYKVDKFQFYLYDIFNIDTQEYYLPSEVAEVAEKVGIRHVPILNPNVVTRTGEATVETLLQMAEGKSTIGAKPEREGLVFKSKTKAGVSFKVVSNKWLMKNDG